MPSKPKNLHPAPRTPPAPRKRPTGLTLSSAGLPHLVTLLQQHNLTVAHLARCIGRTKANLHRSVCTGATSHELINDIEAVLREAGIQLPADLWTTRDGIDLAANRRRLRSLRDGALIAPVYASTITTQIRRQHQDTILETLPVQPLTNTTLRHFGLSSDPFQNEIASSADIFWTDEHQECLNLIERAATKQGLYCIQGEVGSGKTTMKMECLTRLPDTVRVIEPKHPTTRDTNAGNLMETILLGLAGGSGSPKSIPAQRERRALRVEDALKAVEAQGMTAVLIIEEGHDRSKELLRELKRFHELRHGFARLLGIVILAQPEFQRHLDDLSIREFTDRCAVFHMRGLGNEAPRYLAHKLERAGGRIATTWEESGVRALCEYCTRKDAHGHIHGPYPLQVNKVAAAAMNKAADLGKKKVTAEHVDMIAAKQVR